jgi:hypothetical protein
MPMLTPRGMIRLRRTRRRRTSSLIGNNQSPAERPGFFVSVFPGRMRTCSCEQRTRRTNSRFKIPGSSYARPILDDLSGEIGDAD